MPELSQVVLQRLASRRAAGDHPDADTLTAYTEQLLSPGERNRVLEHLAVCSPCREIVALSQPETPETLPVRVAASPKRAWRWKPALGLAASLATLAAITTVIVELPRKPATFESAGQSAPADRARADKTAPATTQPESLATNATEAPETNPPSRTRVAANATNNGSNNVAAMGGVLVSPPPRVVSATSASTVTLSGSGIAAAKSSERDYVNKQMFVSGQAGNEPIPYVDEIPSAPLPRGLAQNQFPPPLSNAPLSFADIPPQTQDGKVVRSRQFSNAPGYHFGIPPIPNLPALGRKAERGVRGVEALARRGVAIQPGALSFSAMESNALAPSLGDQMQAEAEPKDRMRDLDRSSAFSQRALAGGRLDGTNNNLESALWKVSGGNLLKSTDATTWTAGYAPGEIDFTAVAARGANIWAGGANAALIHSVNGGASWERITLGASAAGAITSIEFGGASVRIRSSSGQEWSSQDSGKTWSLEK